MNKLKMHSPDLTQAKIYKLAELFPNCVAEAADANGVVKRSIDFVDTPEMKEMKPFRRVARPARV